MDEITLDDKTYVSSKKAAQITGYAKDYVGQLCREGRVEARLVGRNWYVLEASIRAHRFGSESEEKPAIGIEMGGDMKWQPSNYSSETPSEPIPLIVPQESAPQINILEGRNPEFSAIKPEIPEVSSKVVKEMQSAWHDWFAKTNELKVSEEILLENHVNQIEKDSEPVTLEKVTEIIENKEEKPDPVSEVGFGEEEIVPIHRTFSAPAPVQAPVAPAAPSTRTYGASREIPSHMYQPIPSEGRIIHERRVITRKKPSTTLKILLVLLAAVVVGTTLISSGVTSSFLAQHGIQNPAIQYLVGESTLNKLNR
jgi:hypothetical protein